ncbi:MAG: phosphoenolpyruvate---glycerone phosphotransferase subunit DhaK [Frankiaceae bacterium]|nr:phosphoenolpyruvate---glycerone phosphotransferase subunit DhaK [Frankiaceae bacterium]
MEACARFVQAKVSAYDELDAAAGDGDFGGVLALAGRRVESALASDGQQGGSRAVFLAAATAVGDVGGTTGPIWGAGLLRLAETVGDNPSKSDLGTALRGAANAISELGGAKAGDKTLLDALLPAAEALEGGGATDDAVAAARSGADSTSELTAVRGRASYQGEKSQGAPDAGAVAIADLVEFVGGLLAGTADAPGPVEDAAAAAGGGRGAHGHLVRDPDALVDEALAGLALAHPDLLRVEADPRFAVRVDAPVAGKVGLVSGGGAGHEPMHAGLIGPGLLDAACPGEVFASPSASQVAAAIRACDSGGGVLLIVKNYTGDVLNFRLAAQLVAADGIRTETVLVADDVAVDGSTATIGRRGVAGTVLVEKICGAAAEAGADLDALAVLGRRVAATTVSMGAAVSGVTLPAGGDPATALEPGQMEVGVGIHGEPGRDRRDAEPADAVVAGLLDAVLDDLPDGDGELLVFTNNLGGLPALELYAAHHLAVAALEERGLTVGRHLVAPLVTSLGMVGLSITLLRLDEELTRYWDAPCRSQGWTVS